MGPICFDNGYGPFRWVCLSGKDEDLRRTDQTAMACIDPTVVRRIATITIGLQARKKTNSSSFEGAHLYADEEGA